MKNHKYQIHFKLFLLFGVIHFSGYQAFSNTITLEDYKKQVGQVDPRLQSAEIQQRGAENTLEAGGMLTSIQLVANASYLDDQRPNSSPTTMGSQIQNRTYSLGLQQQSKWGVQWGLNQYVSQTTVNGVNPAILPVPNYYDTYPRLDLSFSLWRNVFGRETQSQVEQITSQSRAQKIQADAQLVLRNAEIEMAYYQLLAQQELYKTQQENLGRAEKILAYADSRVRRNLTDRSDLYQSQAAVNQRKIDLQNTEKNLLDATRKFNILRGVDSPVVSETLYEPQVNLDLLDLKDSPTRVRLEAKSQLELLISQQQGYLASLEKNKPDLKLSVSHLLQGRDADLNTAHKYTYEQKKDYWQVALQFSMPIDQVTSAQLRSGYADLAQSQSLAKKGMEEDQTVQWKNTVATGHFLKNQILILRQLEEVQAKKADLERNKLNQGRSTTFQVINFEQDFVNVRSQRVALELQIRQFISQLSLYQE